ncbi:insulinase family protein [Marinobacter fonticola]|uniref:insulinase family protein n=1 Tax=Marinobacter fonticola TaxID=2603215 RepID=UPI001D0D87E7|nr:insulinase family protein [Marinobacter fonticola]
MLIRHARPTRSLAQLSLLILFVLTLGSATAAVDLVKSPNDDARYRYLTLENGLKVLLISNPSADKGAASMNVSIGSGDDPANREGLAHFLEHMLFLGTEKYPEPGEYQQFIASHGGGHNAFTSFQDTNYFFDVQAKHLEPALDRFAQQFSAPLFTADLVEREMNAVHSEYSSKLKEDSRRYFSAEKAIYNPEHAYSQFAVGNLETLANRPDDPIREDLVAFWENHYSANVMSLAVYGKQTLNELEKMVRPRFSKIENRELSAKEHTAPLFKPDFLPALMRVQSVKDLRQLEMVFPLPSLREDYAVKPAGYVANLLGHEGQGSLLNVLKSAGLAESLSAGQGLDTGQSSSLNVSMSLTPKGLEQWRQVVDLTFDYIRMIREDGIKQRYFEEIQQVSDIAFRFQEASEPIHKVSRLAMQMQHVAPEDILQAPWMMETYTPEKYRQVLDRLTPDSVLITLLSPESLPESAPRTQWYDTPYQVKVLESGDVGKAPESLVAQLGLPDPNPFIPENFAMVEGETMPHPVALDAPGAPKIWYARDTQFNTPKANVYLSLRSPETRDSARGQVLTSLLVDSIRDNLNAYAYPAQLAGLDYAVYNHLRGITLRVGGYDDKLHVLLRRIMNQVAGPEIDSERFEINRKQLIDDLRNQSKGKPVQQASSQLQSTLIEGAWSAEDKLEQAETVTLDELQAFARTFLAEVDPVMLAHGNLTEASVINLQRQANAILFQNSEIVDVPRSGIRNLPEGQTDMAVQVDHPDTGYVLYLQGDSTRFEERARHAVLAQIISAPFYESLRTRQQLGYIVSASSYEILEVPALGFMVQSPSADLATIDEAVSGFFNTFGKTLAEFSDTDLEREKQAVLSQLLAQDRRLGEISERYWREIDRGEFAFNSREKLAEAIRNVTLEDIRTTYQGAVDPRSHALRVYTGTDINEEQEQVDALRSVPFVY